MLIRHCYLLRINIAAEQLACGNTRGVDIYVNQSFIGITIEHFLLGLQY